MILKRRNSHVLEEEIERQKEYIHRVADRNDGKVLKYYLNTFGCQMNEHDSEKLAGMLSNMGYIETDDINESDLIIYNTCCVREHAEQKVYGHLGALKKLKEEKPELKITICGCMMQQGEVVSHIKKTYRHVDLIFGTHNLYKFPELLLKSFDRDKMLIDVLDTDGEIVENIPVKRKDSVKAWITVMYGCNNFCSYCIVPYVRGRERSREVKDIKEEVMMLGRQGFKEITLLGQNVNSYGKDLDSKATFAELLYQLNEVPGIERIRFLTSHPKDLCDELIYAIRDLSKVCEHLHLPIQAGSTKVLREMNRGYTKEQYLELVMKLKENIPGISLTTDIIVGFPGETDEDFEDTLDVIKKVRFDSAYTFLYSKRTGTPAAKSKNQILDKVKKERFENLLTLQNSISREINETYSGKKVEILVEGISKTNDNIYTGRTRTNKIVNYKGNKDDIGKLKNILIGEVKTWSLAGKVITD